MSQLVLLYRLRQSEGSDQTRIELFYLPPWREAVYVLMCGNRVLVQAHTRRLDTILGRQSLGSSVLGNSRG